MLYYLILLDQHISHLTFKLLASLDRWLQTVDKVFNNHLLLKVDAIVDLNFVYELVEDKGRITINMVKVIRF